MSNKDSGRGLTARPRIAVTPRSLSGSSHPALDALKEAGFDVVFPAPGRVPSSAELLATIPACVGYLAGTEIIDESLLLASRSLRVISRNGVGIDAIDIDAAERSGVSVLTAPASNAQGVAELALALILSGVRSIPWHDSRLKNGKWERRMGSELAGRLLGVVGCGQIGQRVTRMALALGMRVIAYDAYPSRDFAPGGEFEWVSLDELLTTANVVTLHAPGSPDGPIINAGTVASLRPGTFLVNTARASLVDTGAVLAGLETGRLSGYATDVFDTEPPAPEPLFSNERVITTPHLGGYTVESVDRAAEAAVVNLLRVLQSP